MSEHLPSIASNKRVSVAEQSVTSAPESKTSRTALDVERQKRMPELTIETGRNYGRFQSPAPGRTKGAKVVEPALDRAK